MDAAIVGATVLNDDDDDDINAMERLSRRWRRGNVMQHARACDG
ncbi:MAG: hypothetical protein AAFO91_18215 [Bacteroidota bacterium]